MLRYYFCAICAALIAISTVPASASVVIDSFDTAQRQDTDPTTVAGPSGVASGAGILGTERDVIVTVESGSVPRVRINIDPDSSSLALYEESNLADGRFEIQYDGVDGDPFAVNPVGLGSIDLTQGGATGFIFQDFNNGPGSNASDFTITVYTDAANSSQRTFTIPDNTMMDFFVPFASFTGSADFTDVGAIVFEGDIDNEVGTDFNLDGLATGGQPQMAPIPEPSSLLLIGFGAMGLAGFGRRRRRQEAAEDVKN